MNTYTDEELNKLIQVQLDADEYLNIFGTDWWAYSPKNLTTRPEFFTRKDELRTALEYMDRYEPVYRFRKPNKMTDMYLNAMLKIDLGMKYFPMGITIMAARILGFPNKLLPKPSPNLIFGLKKKPVI